MMMIFVPFAAWFAGEQMDLLDYPAFFADGALIVFRQRHHRNPILTGYRTAPG